MKRFVISAILAGMVPLAVFAIDANQLHYVEILPAQAATLEKTDLLLLGPVANTNGEATVGSAVNVSAYEGYGVIVMGQGARSGEAHSSVISVAYSYDDSTYTLLCAATQATDTAKFTSSEFDFDTLQGTNAALYLKATFTNVTGDTSGMIGDAVLVYDAARSDQTITGGAVDVSSYKGNATILTAMGGAVNESAAYTNTVTIQHSANGSTGWVTVTNLAGTAAVETIVGATGEVDTYPIDVSRLHKYIRAVSVQQHDVGGVGVYLVAPMKSE